MSENAKPQPPISAFKAVFKGRCPVCRKGAVFSGPWHRLNFLETNARCPVCDTQFEVEPGFFWGAMFVTYAVNVANLVAVSLVVWLFFNPESAWWYIGVVVAVIVLTIPFNARFARMVWLYLFGFFKYDPSK
jgi:uncharacterized protein (DUF983 family)